MSKQDKGSGKDGNGGEAMTRPDGRPRRTWLRVASIVFVAAFAAVLFAWQCTSPRVTVNVPGWTMARVFGEVQATAETLTATNIVATNSARVSTRTAGLANYNGSGVLGNYAGSSCGAGSAFSALSAAGAPTCSQFVNGLGSGSDLAIFTAAGAIGNYTGSSSGTCGAGSAVTQITISAQGSASVTCATAGTGTVTSTGSAGFIAAFTTATNIGNWSGSGCGAGSALVTISGSGAVTCIAIPGNTVSATAAEWGWFGVGGDSAITFDGTTTVTVGGVSMTASGSAYTLGTNIRGTNITVNAGVVVNMGGFNMAATQTFTNNGTVQDSGAAGANGSAAGAGANGGARAATFYSTTAGGGSTPQNSLTFPRGVGVSASSNASAGSGGTLAPGTNGSNGAPCSGGGGGGGGDGIVTSGANGITGGSIALNGVNFGTANVDNLQSGTQWSASNVALFTLTGGGGGQGGQGGTGAGQTPGRGGGGAAGGYALIYAQTMAGSGSFQAKGGNGGNGGNASLAGAGGGGGGAGGGGGLVVLVYSHNSGTWTTNVAGGAGGAKGSGIRSGADGFDGGTGGSGGDCKVLSLNLSGDGT